jgi:hypothetical protein
MESQDATGTPAQATAGVKRRMPFLLAGAASLIVLGAVVWLTGFGSYVYQCAAYTPTPPTFAGSSESLQHTVIVPTLDSPCPPNKNVIWCSSFQLAWNELKDKVVHAPLQVVGAEEIAARLNAAPQSTSDLEPSSFYVAGGRIGDGIVDKIKKEMAKKFPSRQLPDLQKYADEPAGLLAYSYLSAQVPFKYPFRQVERPFLFADSSGGETAVEAFGVWNYSSRYDKIRKQVEVMYYRRGSNRRANAEGPQTTEYVLDLCKDSQPYQIVVALVEPRDLLAETLEYIRRQVEGFQKGQYTRLETQLKNVDEVEIPEMVWRIDHPFQELIGKTVSNVGLPIVGALQTMEFRLDRTGVVLESDTRLGVAALPREFVFNRPFLVYMQKRGAQQPFFVMWVDNAELLTRK